MGIKSNIEQVQARIKAAKERVGRNDEVTLIAVTKTVEDDKVIESLNYGVTDIGENKPQELTKRFELLDNRVAYHMIGNLQTNKVKYIINKVKLIHSLERINLAKEINKRAMQNNQVQECLIQMNISGEESKSGISESELLFFLEDILKMPYIRIKGLMTMAPFTDSEDTVRRVFRKLYECKELVEKQNYSEADMSYLSMGMSQDFEIAIEEGSNMVRVGTMIYGSRNYGGK